MKKRSGSIGMYIYAEIPYYPHPVFKLNNLASSTVPEVLDAELCGYCADTRFIIFRE
jgi:hypothetical protein